MSHLRPLAPVLVLVVVLVAGGWRWYPPWQDGAASKTLSASGTLEADEILIAPRVTGTITALPVPAGAEVAAGAVVATIDDRLIQLQARQAAGADPSALFQLQLQAEDYTLRSPVSGVVTRLPAHVGELAVPGQVLLAVSDLSTLNLTLYVRSAELARVAVGQTLIVTADPYPGRAFQGTVTSVNQQAEFTPRNVQTRTDRLNLVFGVQATVANTDRALKPGMPVDVQFAPAAGLAR